MKHLNLQYAVRTIAVIFSCLFMKVNAQSPTITSFLPPSTCPSTSATIVINGSNFTNATAVTVGSNVVDSFNIISDKCIIAYIGGGKTGAIAITNSNGTSTSSASFTDNGEFTAYAYIPNGVDGTVSVINTNTNDVITTIHGISGNPSGVTISPDKSKVYVATGVGIYVINTTNNTIIKRINATGGSVGIAISSDGKSLYSSNGAFCTVLNIARDSVIAKIHYATNADGNAIGNGGLDVAITSDGKTVYAIYNVDTSLNGSMYYSYLAVINTSSNNVIAKVPLGSYKYMNESLIISPDGSKVYAATGSVSVINSATNSIVASFNGIGNSICINPGGTKVYVGGSKVRLINTTTESLIDSLPFSSENGIGMSPDGTRLYLITTENPGVINSVNTTTKAIIASISVGSSPQPAGNFIGYVPTACPPSIASFNPTTATTGITVTIIGTSLSGTTSVSFGGTQATSFIVVNDSTITAVVSDGSSGSIAVTTAVGTASLAGFLAAPSITSFTPTSVCPDSTTTVFITGNNFINITSVNVGGNAVDSFKVNSPTSITAYVAPNSIGFIKANSPISTAISRSSFTNNLGFTPYAYSSGYGGSGYGFVTVVNVANDSIIRYISVDMYPNNLTVSPDGTTVYVASSDYLSIINTASNTVTKKIAGLGDTYISVSPDGAKVYLSSNGGGISVISKVGGIDTVTKTIPMYNAGHLCFSPDGNKIYLIANGVSIIDVNTDTVIKTITMGSGLSGICISPDGYKVYVTNFYDNSVSVINTLADTVEAIIKVGNYPQCIIVSPDGTQVYVANIEYGEGGTISIINTSTNKVVATINANNELESISLSQDGTKLYVPDGTSNTVSVINTLTNKLVGRVNWLSTSNAWGNFIANVPTACGFSEPVSIKNIEAAVKNSAVYLSWQTATELNTSHFTIQHSTTGTSFTDIGTVKAIGSGANSYSFTDNNPANGINYYRLESIDKDGSTSYSKIVSVNFGDKQSFSINPNPARDFATISFSNTVNNATIAVYDITGKVVIAQSLNGNANYFKLNTQTLTNGVYAIKVNTAKGSYNEKLLINK